MPSNGKSESAAFTHTTTKNSHQQSPTNNKHQMFASRKPLESSEDCPDHYWQQMCPYPGHSQQALFDWITPND